MNSNNDDNWKRYADIINLERPASQKHPPMSLENRAAQFAPFAALSGHGELISQAENQNVSQDYFENHLSITDADCDVI